MQEGGDEKEREGKMDVLGQGKENSRRYLKENPEVAATIEQRIKVKLGIGVTSPVADLPEEAVAEAVAQAAPHA